VRLVAEFDAEAVKNAAEKALTYAILGEEGKNDDAATGEFADVIAEIVEMGPRAVHVALSGWCAFTLLGFAQAQGEPLRPLDGFWSLEVEDGRTGETVSIDKIGNPAVRDAMRIAVCFGNKDQDTIAAIVRAAWNGGGEGLAAQTAVSLAEARGGS
jgi:hypothetical protein